MIAEGVAFLTGRLLAASLLAALLVPLVWAACRLARGMPAAVQATLWWLVALRILLAFVPVPALKVPILPFDSPVGLAPFDSPVALAQGGQGGRGGPVAGSALAVGELPSSPAASGEPASTRHLWLVVLWLGALILHAGYLASIYRRQRRVVAGSVLLDHAVTDVARLTAIMGVRHVPEVRASTEIDAPHVAGVVQPTVLVPADFVDRLSPAERAMAICHELAHIRRRDLAWGWVPAICERLLFFHPLALFAAREYAAAREGACDAAVLRMLAATPAEYGRLLLRLGVTGPAAALVASATSPSRSSLRRRLEMLNDSTNRSKASRWVLAAALCALIPWQLTARTPAAQEPTPTPARAVQRATHPAETPSVSAVAVFEQDAAMVVERAERTAPAAIREAQELIRQAERELQRQLEIAQRRLEERGLPPTHPDAMAVERQLLELRGGEAARETRQAADGRRTDEDLRRELEIAELRMRDAIQRAVERKERFEQDNRRLLELRGGDVAARQADLRAQMDQLRVQLQGLARQLMETAEQQQILEDAQRRVADQIEMLRQALETMARP
jgi:beta-lactamase regulating signal transducer with metallopeptidase domain